MKARGRLLWITDPWKTLDHGKDTTLRLVEESLKMGFRSFWCDVQSIRIEKGRVVLDAEEIREVGPARATEDFKRSPVETREPGDFKYLFYRTDPPVDLAYLIPLQLLDLALRGDKKTKMVNPLSVLLHANEKAEAFRLPTLFPRALVSSQRDALEKFVTEEKQVILKPLYQAQSKGVQLLDLGTMEMGKISAALLEPTEGFRVPVILQEFLPGIKKGEQRLWFVSGKLIAHVRKVPKAGQVVINMDQGGTVEKSTLSAKEKKAVLQIGRYLKSRQIEWAAVDLIDGKVTDFNFTSPGLIVAMEKCLGQNLAKKILASL